MECSAAAVERAMTYQQVIMRALAGTWTWLKAADVLDIHPRSLRRWRARYEQDPARRSSGSCTSTGRATRASTSATSTTWLGGITA